MLDEDPPVMGRERGHNVLPFQLSADEIGSAVELDRAVTVDLADERHSALGDGKSEATVAIHIGFEREAVRKMAENRPGLVAEDSGKPGSMIGEVEASAVLLEVVVAKEAGTCPPQRPQVGTEVKKDPFLPESVEAFHRGVTARLSWRDKAKVDTQQKMEPDDLGEAVAIAASSRRGHLVVHLGNLGEPHKAPGIKEMAAERDRLLIGELAGRSRLPDDIDGLERIEAGDASRPPQITGPDQVGLLEVAHSASSDVGIGGTAGKAMALGLFRSSGPGQDLLDRRDRGKPPQAPSLKLEMNRLGADAGESPPTALMGRQLVTESQDFADERLRRPIADTLRNPTLVAKTIPSKSFVSFDPLGQPTSSSTGRLQSTTESSRLFINPNRFETNLIFPAFLHRPRLLPNDLGRSLGDEQKSSRCPYGFLVYDVLTETL
jgi:hypothetical protein